MTLQQRMASSCFSAEMACRPAVLLFSNSAARCSDDEQIAAITDSVTAWSNRDATSIASTFEELPGSVMSIVAEESSDCELVMYPASVAHILPHSSFAFRMTSSCSRHRSNNRGMGLPSSWQAMAKAREAITFFEISSKLIPIDNVCRCRVFMFYLLILCLIVNIAIVAIKASIARILRAGFRCGSVCAVFCNDSPVS